MALGIQDKFSWKQVGQAAISGGITGGLSGVNFTNSALNSVSNIAVRAAVSNALSQGISVAVGLQERFSWAGVAAAGAGGAIGQYVGDQLQQANAFGDWGQFGESVARGTLRGFAAGLTTAALRGGRVSVAQVAADVFGQALGNASVDHTISNSTTAPTLTALNDTTASNTEENLEGIAPAPTDANSTVRTGLRSRVDQLVSKSTSLQNDLKRLSDKEWVIRYGTENEGSSANRTRKEIVIDLNEKNNSELIVQTLAHETGHALYDYKLDYSSKSSYIAGALADEGAATLNNIKIQREILATGGPDIQISGNSGNYAVYNKAYDQFLNDGNADMARKVIGSQFGTGEHASVKVNEKNLNYNEYYGSWYERTFPKK